MCVRRIGRRGDTDFEEFLDDEGGLYGCYTTRRDEENVSVVGSTLELGDELAGHQRGRDGVLSKTTMNAQPPY